jgi:4-amino-4-deoxy-L-arabinose transferase-like glycosyltransferase
VLFGAACLVFAGAQWRRGVTWRSTLSLPWITATMIGMAIALPWYAAALYRAGSMLLQSHVVAEQIQQFKGSNAASSVFTYASGFVAVSPLWCFVTLAALWSLLRVWRQDSKPPGGAGFCAVWLVVFIGLFQISAFRRRHYLLPVLPAMALLAGWYLDTHLPQRLPQSIKQWFAGIGAWWWGVALAASSIAAYVVNRAIPQWIDPAQLTPLDATLGLLGVFVSTAGLVITLRAAWHRNLWLCFASLVTALAATYVLTVPSGEIAASTLLSPVPVVRRVESALPEGASVEVAGVRNDLTLLLQYYAKHPERWLVEHVKRNAPRVERTPGYYLFTEPEWTKERGQAGWSERANATFYDRDHPMPLTLARFEGPQENRRKADRGPSVSVVATPLSYRLPETTN